MSGSSYLSIHCIEDIAAHLVACLQSIPEMARIAVVLMNLGAANAWA
jgi:hypothetical protein